MRPLEPMLVPEKLRNGELDPENCGSCAPDEHTIWHDDLWQVRGGWEPGGLPAGEAQPSRSAGEPERPSPAPRRAAFAPRPCSIPISATGGADWGRANHP